MKTYILNPSETPGLNEWATKARGHPTVAHHVDVDSDHMLSDWFFFDTVDQKFYYITLPVEGASDV